MTARSDRSKKATAQKRAPFIQPLTEVIRNHGQLTPAQLAVYMDLQTYDWDGKGTWVSQKTIADEIGISERTVRDAVRELARLGAIDYQPRPGRSSISRVKSGWVPADSGNRRRSKRSKTTPSAPVDFAADPGKSCRTPRQDLPHTPAESAAKTDTRNYTQEAEAKTDRVTPPTASEGPLSGTTAETSQEECAAPAAEKTAALASTDLSASGGFGLTSPEAPALWTTAQSVRTWLRKLASSNLPPGSTRSRRPWASRRPRAFGGSGP